MEKILYTHLWNGTAKDSYVRGEDYVDFAPDRVMQDATAQMALLQFMQAGKRRVAVPSTAHADHLIQTKLRLVKIYKKELIRIMKSLIFFLQFVINMELDSGNQDRYYTPSSFRELFFFFPGWNDDWNRFSHCKYGRIRNGALVLVDRCSGCNGRMHGELKFPKLIGVKLTGKLNGWTAKGRNFKSI